MLYIVFKHDSISAVSIIVWCEDASPKNVDDLTFLVYSSVYDSIRIKLKFNLSKPDFNDTFSEMRQQQVTGNEPDRMSCKKIMRKDVQVYALKGTN